MDFIVLYWRGWIQGRRAEGEGFRVRQGGFRAEGEGFEVRGGGFRAEGGRFNASRGGFRAEGEGFEVRGGGFRAGGGRFNATRGGFRAEGEGFEVRGGGFRAGGGRFNATRGGFRAEGEGFEVRRGGLRARGRIQGKHGLIQGRFTESCLLFQRAVQSESVPSIHTLLPFPLDEFPHLFISCFPFPPTHLWCGGDNVSDGMTGTRGIQVPCLILLPVRQLEVIQLDWGGGLTPCCHPVGGRATCANSQGLLDSRTRIVKPEGESVYM
jgi:hypothetical protein